jgi:hypothetical protein
VRPEKNAFLVHEGRAAPAVQPTAPWGRRKTTFPPKMSSSAEKNFPPIFSSSFFLALH